MIPLDILMVIALIGCIMLGFPVSFSITGTAVTFAFIGWMTGEMDFALIGAVGQRIFGVLTNDVLIAIPLFVLMGNILEKSHIAEDLLENMSRLFGSLRGGLGLSVILVGALLAASTGIVGATVIAMGLIALPTMLRSGYNPSLASGIICTAGTLGQIIPPSTLMIILSDVISNAYQQAQFTQGKFSIETISVGQVFAAALLPGLMLVLIYIAYLLIRVRLIPTDAPLPKEQTTKPTFGELAQAILPPIFLILAVLGSILSGLATSTESASVGAVGAFLMMTYREKKYRWLVLAGIIALLLLFTVAGSAPVRLQKDVLETSDWVKAGAYTLLAVMGVGVLLFSVWKAYRKKVLHPAMTSTMVVTAMIFTTIVSASMFSLVFVGLGGEELVEELLKSMPGGPVGALIFCLLLVFVLGFFLDFVEITVIVLPLILPPLILMGHDPIWLAVLLAINLQTSFLTPPFGFSLFYFRSVAPESVTTWAIYRGVAPFILLQALGVGLVWLLPFLATWLPKVLY